MKILGNISILAGYKTEDVTKPLQSLLQRANLSSCGAPVFGVNLSGFVFVQVWDLFGLQVHGFLLGLVPGQTSANAFEFR